MLKFQSVVFTVFSVLFVLSPSQALSQQACEANPLYASGECKVSFFKGTVSVKAERATRKLNFLKDGKTIGTISLRGLKSEQLTRYYIDRLCLQSDSGAKTCEYVVSYEVDSGGSGTSFIGAFDEKNFKEIWNLPLPGFNVGPFASAKSYLYVGALGVAAKLNALTGEVVWMQGDLYTRVRLDGVSAVQVEDNVVTFQAVAGPLVRIHDVTGGLLP